MKKITSVLFILVLALLTATAAPAEMLAGGWETVEYQAVMLPDEDAQAAFDKATAEIDGMIYIPVALIGKQIVAGTNYCILCQMIPVVPDAEPVWALVFLYEDLEGNAQIVDPPYEIYYDRHTPWTE